MRYFPFIAILSVLVYGQVMTVPEPLPVDPPEWVMAVQDPDPVVEPPEFPPGVFCENPEHGTNPPHPCACRAMESCEKPDQGQGTGPSENKQCAQWCHKDHCHCTKKCE